MKYTLDNLRTWDDLKKYFPEECADVDNCFVAAEGLIFDQDNHWILHRRGPKCRDEHYKLEGIGGRIDKNEEFMPALLREISEEAGVQVKIKIVDILEVRKDTVYDYRLNKKITWLIVSYICAYMGGQFEVCEPEKNLGYEKVEIGNANKEELSSSSKAAYIKLLENWQGIREKLEQGRTL